MYVTDGKGLRAAPLLLAPSAGIVRSVARMQFGNTIPQVLLQCHALILALRAVIDILLNGLI